MCTRPVHVSSAAGPGVVAGLPSLSRHLVVVLISCRDVQAYPNCGVTGPLSAVLSWPISIQVKLARKMWAGVMV